ncbi:DUF2147 domain-containing protein [uncultured Sphingomonas sp.]|uniref:DUF2147 domain-containing protein n=1 Tax=uncultured Sphingomonas sp. TaxID=158754 RepID=UPI0035CAF752
MKTFLIPLSSVAALCLAAGASLPPTTAMRAVPAADPATAPAPSAPGGWTGVWRNMKNTIHIRATRCGVGMCGVVIWASDKVKADVAASGRTMIGMELFRDFRRADGSRWKGKVFVPDIGRTLSGTIEVTDPDSITASGCLILGLGCKTQHWKRVS